MKQNLDPVAVFKKRHLNKLFVRGMGLAAFVAALIVLAYFLDREATDVQKARVELSRLTTSLNGIAGLASDKPKAEALLPLYVSFLPVDIEVPTKVVPAIRNLALVHKLRFDLEFGSSNFSGTESVTAVDFRAKADGALRDIIDFISDLETERGILGINSWNITQLAAGQFQINFTGNIYTRISSEDEFGAAASTTPQN